MRILVAEDDPVIGLGLCARLRALGHDVVGLAGDGAEAIELGISLRPDLYLFDIDMPHVDGLAAAFELSRRGVRRPVVVITGVEDPDLIERSIATGVSAYLAKPVNDRQLEGAIQLAAIRHREYLDVEAEVIEARQALVDRKLVERAKSLLMQSLSLSEPEAFRRIQQGARRRNLKLVEMARLLLEDADVLLDERGQ